MSYPRRLLLGLLVGLGAALLAGGLWVLGWLEGWERATWSVRARTLAKPTPSTARIKLVLVDQASLEWGRKENGWSWPWPREVAGTVLAFAKRGGAASVAFDVLYTEPSVYGVGDDEAFRKAIQEGPPFAGAALLGREGELKAWPIGTLPPFSTLEGASLSLPAATLPIPEVREAAARLGNVQGTPDSDGMHRRVPLVRTFEGRALLPLGLAGRDAARPKPAALGLQGGTLTLDGKPLPVDGEGRALLRFVGPSGTHQAFSAAAIIQSELRMREGLPPTVDPAVFKDCHVFFGYSAPGLFDLQPTPVGDKYPGVEIHATLLDNALEGAFLRPVGRGLTLALLGLLALGAGVAGLLSRRAWLTVTGFVLFLALPFALGFGAYASGFALPILPLALAGGLAQLGAVVVNYATEGRQKAFLKSAFRYYLGAEVIEQILKDPSKLSLGGERRELTIFFSDIEKFSGFSERLDPQALITLLNEYLSAMGAILQEEGAYLDKYIGDAIVAFWNAPVGQPDHARRACRAAVRCQRRLAELRPELEARLGVVVKARVGLNTGVVAVGNMGSYDRFNYTILGDAANLASRLEGANKAFGTFLMVSEATWQASGGDFVGRPLGRLRVMGRNASVRVFELAGLPEEPRPAHFAPFEAALEAFEAGRFPEALAGFEALPDDPASRMYIGQCRELMAHPPEAWDGVLHLTEK